MPPATGWSISRQTHGSCSPIYPQVIQLCQAKSKGLRNWTVQYCRPDCTVLFKFAWDNQDLDLLVITTSFGPTATTEAILDGYDLTCPGFLNNSIAATIRHLIAYGQAQWLCSFFRRRKFRLTPKTLPFYIQAMKEWTSPNSRGHDDDSWGELLISSVAGPRS